MPMPEFDPDSLVGRTFLLPPEENGDRFRAKVTQKVVEIIEDQEGKRVKNINLIMKVGKGKVEEIISYNQLIDCLEDANEQDNVLDQELLYLDLLLGIKDQ